MPAVLCSDDWRRFFRALLSQRVTHNHHSKVPSQSLSNTNLAGNLQSCRLAKTQGTDTQFKGMEALEMLAPSRHTTLGRMLSTLVLQGVQFCYRMTAFLP